MYIIANLPKLKCYKPTKIFHGHNKMVDWHFCLFTCLFFLLYIFIFYCEISKIINCRFSGLVVYTLRWPSFLFAAGLPAPERISGTLLNIT